MRKGMDKIDAHVLLKDSFIWARHVFWLKEGIAGDDIVYGPGTLQCITQQQPAIGYIDEK